MRGGPPRASADLLYCGVELGRMRALSSSIQFCTNTTCDRATELGAAVKAGIPAVLQE